MIQDPRVNVSHNLAPSGDEKLRVGGLFNIINMSPAIDPIANGLGVAIYGASGAELLSLFIPPGAAPDSQSPGWKVNRSGTSWGYKDKTGTVVPGIRRVTVKHKLNLAPGIFKIGVSGKEGSFTIPESELPLRLDVVLGGVPQAVAGQCAAATFNEVDEDRPRCQSRSAGDRISCN